MQFIGHRFSGIGSDENTFGSLKRVLLEKPGGVECDIFFTKDGIPVVTHAKKLNGREELISEMTFSEFQKHQNKIDPNQQVPTLENILKLCLEYKKENPEFRINIENKDPKLEAYVDELTTLINRYDPEGNMAYFSCFQEDKLDTLKNALPNHKCEMLLCASTSGLARGSGSGPLNRALPGKWLPKKRLSALGMVLKTIKKLTGKKDFIPSTFDQMNELKDNENIDAWNIEGFGLSASVIELAIEKNKPINIWFINERPPIKNLGSLKRIMKWQDKYPNLELNFITDYITEMKTFTQNWKDIEKKNLKNALLYLDGKNQENTQSLPETAKEL